MALLDTTKRLVEFVARTQVTALWRRQRRRKKKADFRWNVQGENHGARLFVTFVRPDAAAHDFQEVWAGLCPIFSSPSSERRTSSVWTRPSAVWTFDRTTGTGFRFFGIENPNVGELAVDPAVESMQLAEAHREQLGWHRYVLATNVAIRRRPSRRSRRSVGRYRLGQTTWNSSTPRCWSALCAKPWTGCAQLVRLSVRTTPEAVTRPFERGVLRPQDRGVPGQDEGHRVPLVLTNNRTRWNSRSHSPPTCQWRTCWTLEDPAPTCLDSTPFPDLGTSARLSLSITIDGMAQSFNKTLSELEFTRRRNFQLW